MSDTSHQGKKHYLISHDKVIYIEEKNVFENDRKIFPIEDPNGSDKIQSTQTSEEFAQDKIRQYYSSFLKARFENLCALTGAGSSIGFGGQTREGLWNAVKVKLSESKFKSFCETIKCDWNEYSKSKDIEALLTNAYQVSHFLKKETKSDSEKIIIDVQQVIDDIESVIRECCKISLSDSAPHTAFIRKITARKFSDPRAKIFTLNYDTLFEQAAHAAKCWVIDGFSFEIPRVFRGRNFDFDFVIREGNRVKEEDNYVPNVIHIYKPHGSMDWEKNGDEIIKNPETKTPVIIYPKESKYESSFEQPFFEMMLRFQQEVRKKNALLIVVGFSFYDKHITNVILEALDVNPGLRCLVITRGLETEYLHKLHERAKSSNNLILVEECFADFVKHYPFAHPYSHETALPIGGTSAQ